MTRGRRRALDGAVVLITGASSGVGAALARAASAEGAKLILAARSRDATRRLADACVAAGGDAVAVVCDVTDPGACRDAVDAAVARHGRLDVAVACAGIGMRAPFASLEDLEVLERVMRVDYFGTAHLFHAALPHVLASHGALVAVSSLQGRVGVPHRSGYVAAKHAVQGLCDALRLELRGSGVDVVTVLPHWVRGTAFRARALDAYGSERGDAADGHGRTAVTAERAAAAVLDAIRWRRRETYVPGWTRFLAWASLLAPGLADRIVTRGTLSGANVVRTGRRRP